MGKTALEQLQSMADADVLAPIRAEEVEALVELSELAENADDMAVVDALAAQLFAESQRDANHAEIRQRHRDVAVARREARHRQAFVR